MLSQYLFVACFLGYKTLVFPPGDYVIHERGSVDGFDIVQREHTLVPAQTAEYRCLPLASLQASILLHSMKRGDVCTMENKIITCERTQGESWVF